MRVFESVVRRNRNGGWEVTNRFYVGTRTCDGGGTEHLYEGIGAEDGRKRECLYGIFGAKDGRCRSVCMVLSEKTL